MSSLDSFTEADSIEGVLSPNCTEKLLGHGQAFDLLAKQLSENRLPSGVLLHGPRGIGKATLAFQLAQLVLTTTGDEPGARVREQIVAGAHPNLYVLRRVPREKGTGFYAEIRVDGVRAVLRKLHQTRGRAGHRMLIVDAIDDCNRNAANALLKTLEEPPADTHIVLISHRPGRLLPTIRSRCQAHALRSIADEDLRVILNQHQATDMEMSDAIKIAGGRPRRGFEALNLGKSQILTELDEWLAAPLRAETQQTLKLAEVLTDKKNTNETGFAREMILDWINQEARRLAGDQTKSTTTVLGLWEKANSLFEQTDTFNLDAKQSLIILLDQIVAHAHQTNR